ncbi:glycosyltransferase family 90 protein [Amniculicola lignicola CBS 123094]|uniref:Glycosyltransferase family 90 protein n=1 Tax=Amniculicola lignicola CBS 123094 TaxID=1392246 RepID=A0A6A5W5D9_9PLEO|nr:glycosyltransferase family 90 protein [Amniculicola lignicola CBS 123094]
MHPVIHFIVENALKYQNLLVPVLLVVLASISNIDVPVQHSLLVSTVSWALIWIPSLVCAGISGGSSRSRKTTSWAAGGFLGLAQICDRVACDKEGTWSTKGLLPLLVVLISENEALSRHIALPSYFSDDTSPDANPNNENRRNSRSYRLLVVMIISASSVLVARYTLATTISLGISSVIFTAAGLVLFENALKSPKDDAATARKGLVSANGTFSRRNSPEGQKRQHLSTLRDVAAMIALVCGVATAIIEPAITPHIMSWEPVFRDIEGSWRDTHFHRVLKYTLWMILVNVFVNLSTFQVLFHQGAENTSIFLLFSWICARLHHGTSFIGLWFTILYAAAGILFMSAFASSPSTIDRRSSIRLRRILFGATALSVCLILIKYASGARQYNITTNDFTSFPITSPSTPLGPIPVNLQKGHPAHQLITSAENEFASLLSRQSKTLDEAVQEYKRRNGIAPPPHFDRWYEFATRNNIQLVDEFDTISRTLLPFWALKPSTIRYRVNQALGLEDNALIGISVRDGSIVNMEKGEEWQQQATAGMMKDFVKWLPDMDLPFNIHDEPRVVVPSDELSLLTNKVRNEVIPAAMKNTPRNSFTPRPADLSDGIRFEEAKTSHFNRFAHQSTWTHARLSCPLASQARDIEDSPPDNLTSYAVSPLGHIYNATAFTDICNSPSYSTAFGFFERPNAFNIIHELTPVFSQSKVSSFQDILYPSPWYWFGRVGYDMNKDTNWENKTNSLYWRGSTTGGFSRNGGWRKHHRQRVVRRLNALDKAQIIRNSDAKEQTWELQEVDRRDYDQFIDVKFSHIGQCDPGDCDAQKEFFEVVDRADGQDAWYWKHLLDMDGNAFSGRFYTFLRSRSLTYKMAIFREWHQEWLKPWVHYIPLSLIGDEHLDLIHWFGGGLKTKKEGEADDNKGGNGDSIGEKKAREIAERSTEWAGKALRNEDLEVWFFRLLLEYGRVIDDDREKIGYPGP